MRSKNPLRIITTLASAGALALALAGCPDKDGPMEEAGEKVDDAVENVGDAVDELKE